MIRNIEGIPFPLLASGKVREIFDLGDQLLIVVTDRISAFDVVFDELIPDKGVVLNSISAFWFDQTKDILPNHVLSTDVDDYPVELHPFREQLEGRSMLVRRADMLPVECIVRGYLEGSALKSYRIDGTVNGIRLPKGLRQGDRLPEVLFTPSTKADEGHDENISYDQLETLVGAEQASKLRDASIALYRFAEEFAESRGIIVADSKFEFGILDGGELIVADELFTPDSSRFWDREAWMPGQPQESFDKQFLREWLETLDWDKNPPAPTLPVEIIEKTAERYREAYRRLTGRILYE